MVWGIRRYVDIWVNSVYGIKCQGPKVALEQLEGIKGWCLLSLVSKACKGRTKVCRPAERLQQRHDVVLLKLCVHTTGWGGVRWQ